MPPDRGRRPSHDQLSAAAMLFRRISESNDARPPIGGPSRMSPAATVLGGSPRIYAGGGALQRSGRSDARMKGFSPGPAALNRDGDKRPSRTGSTSRSALAAIR